MGVGGDGEADLHGGVMTTAQEIKAMMDEAMPLLNARQKVLAETLVEGAILRLGGREVCARRARKLRKRNEVVRWVGSTENGKSRFLWMKRIK